MKNIFRDICRGETEYLMKLPEFQSLILQWFTVLTEGKDREERCHVILDVLDLIMQGSYGMHNRAYLLLALESFFTEHSDLCKTDLRNFLDDFCIWTPDGENEQIDDRESHAKLVLTMVIRIYGKDQTLKLVCEMGRDGDTLAHKAARCGFFSLLLDNLIG